MSRSYSDFEDSAFPKLPKRHKSKDFRHSAREAREYFSGEDYDKHPTTRAELSSEKSSIFTYRGVGRGVQGESSN